MALDYRSMRDATQMATAMELAKAQNIGQSAASLGHAGGLAWDAMGGGQGLMNFLKGRINPFTQESIEDPNRVYGQPSGAYGGSSQGSSEESPEAIQGLLSSIARDDRPSDPMLADYQEDLEFKKLQDEGLITDDMLYGPNNMVTDRPDVSPPVGETFGSVDDYGNVESLPGMGGGQGGMLGLIENPTIPPINANQMDTQFGKGFSNLQPDFRMAFRNTGGAKLPNKYSTDPKVLEFLESKGMNPWDVIWE